MRVEVNRHTELIGERDAQFKSANSEVEEVRKSTTRLCEHMASLSEERDLASCNGESALGALAEAERELMVKREHLDDTEFSKVEMRKRAIELK